MYKPGDKFIIEIEEVFTGDEVEEARYRVKGFSTLFFDNYGLNKLKRLEEPAPEPEPQFVRGDEVITDYYGVKFTGLVIGISPNESERYVLIDRLAYPLMRKKEDLEPTGRHFELPLEVNE